MSPHDLRYLEYKKITSRVLENNGFVLAENEKSAELIIYVGYGISNGETKTDHYTVPIYHPNEQKNIQFQNSFGQNIGSATVQNGNPYGGRYEYQQRSMTYTEYTRVVTLAAFDVKTGIPVWQSIIKSTGLNDNLREVFPAMIIGAGPFFG